MCITQIDDKIKITLDNTGRKDSNLFFHIDKLIDRNVFNENFEIERCGLYAGKNRNSYFKELIN